METNEMNRKIAEWMGESIHDLYGILEFNHQTERFDKIKGPYGSWSDAHGDMNSFDTDEIFNWFYNYHSDWNALMPVVERIGNDNECTLPGVFSLLTSRYYDEWINTITDLHLAVFNYINKTA